MIRKLAFSMILFLIFLNTVFGLEITEVMYNPIEDENYNEYVEIYNDEESEIDVTLLSMCGDAIIDGYISKTGENLSSEKVLPRGEYAIITDGGSGSEVIENFDVETDFLFHTDSSSICSRLSNSGKEVYIEKDGDRIDSLEYDDSCDEGESFSEEGCFQASPGEKQSYEEEASSNDVEEQDSLNETDSNEEVESGMFEEESNVDEVLKSDEHKSSIKEDLNSEDEDFEEEEAAFEFNKSEKETEEDYCVYCSDRSRMKFWMIFLILCVSVLMNVFLIVVLFNK
jgi:hypothetical protein